MGLPSAVKMRKFTLTLPPANLTKTRNHSFESTCDLASSFPPSESDTVIVVLLVCAVVIHREAPDSAPKCSSKFCYPLVSMLLTLL